MLFTIQINSQSLVVVVVVASKHIVSEQVPALTLKINTRATNQSLANRRHTTKTYEAEVLMVLLDDVALIFCNDANQMN